MATKSLSNPTIEVNDEVVAYVPNSLKYKTGFGTKSAKAQTSGGNSISIVVTEDAETKVSMVEFKLYVTNKNITRVKNWGALYGSTIRIYEDDTTESFSDMIITDEPENNVGADGDLTVTWNGAPSI